MKFTPRVFHITWQGLELDVHCNVYADVEPHDPTAISLKRIHMAGTNAGIDVLIDWAAIEELCHDELESEE